MNLRNKIKLYYVDLVKGKRKGAPEALFCFLLLLASFIYGFFVKLLLSCYQTGLFKSRKLDCRLISVGNISWGGTGKTPLVEAAAKFLKRQGKKPAILIRGYGKDEVYMLKDKFKDIPVLAGRDRIKSATEALRSCGADTIILDDGFQHWRIARNLDIVLIDSTNPFGNRRLIPRGILREPLSSLFRADIFVLTKSDLAKGDLEPVKKELKRYNPRAPIYEAVHAPAFLRSITSDERIGLGEIKNQRIAIASGIAGPASFAQTLDLLGAKVCLRFDFLDHHRYRQEDLQRIEKACLQHKIETVVTTEKDAAKLAALLTPKVLKIKILALGIEFKIKNEEEFFARLLSGRASGGSILILSDGRAGHLNQSKAVAGIIQKTESGKEDGLNVKIEEVKFKNRFLQTILGICSIFANQGCGSCLACMRFCLKKDSFNKLTQSPADIIVSCGSSLSSVNLFLSYKNKARNIILMKPSFLNLNRFDLVILPEHDRIKTGDNVVQTRIAPNLIDRAYLEKQAKALSNKLQITNHKLQNRGPVIGVFIGGDTAKYRLTGELMKKIISRLKETAKNLDGRILLTSSRRTPKAVEELLKEDLADFEQCRLLLIANEKNIPEAVGGILGLSDIILVSGESISMVSEAITSEKPVLVFKPEKKGSPLEAISLTGREPLSKQDRFLENLEREGILKIVQPESLSLEIEKIEKERPKRFKIQDKELISQAISKFLQI